MTDNVTEWRKLRNELDDMLKAREMKYADAVTQKNHQQECVKGR